MKRIQTFIIGFVLTISGFSQTDVKIRILPSKISTQTEILIPFGDKFIFEKYHYFKHVYFLSLQDTLNVFNDNILKGKTMVVNQKTNYRLIDFCDTTINLIRNSSLIHRCFSMIDDTCKKYIGWDNKDFKVFRHQIAIDEKTEKFTCSNDFQSLSNIRFNQQLDKINDIYKSKQQRTDWVKNNPDKIDLTFIKSFIADFNYCISDKKTFVELVIANPSDLISACGAVENFYDIKWRLDELPKTDRVKLAIAKLEKGNYKGKIYRQILRKLNKNEG